jgi:hypothetical protein
MRFFDRKNQPITHTEWLKLSRDRDYCHVLSSENWYYKLTTSWVGVAMECEETPTIFVLTKRLLQVDPEEKAKPKHWLRPEWFGTLKAAVARHREVEPADAVGFI